MLTETRTYFLEFPLNLVLDSEQSGVHEHCEALWHALIERTI